MRPCDSRRTMSPDEQRIMGLVARHYGYDNAISRRSLVECTQFDDRHIRSVIETLRKNHRKPILSNPESGGYFLPTCEQDEHRSLAPRVAKVRSEFETIRVLSAAVAHSLATTLFDIAPAPKPGQQCLHPQCSNPVPIENENYCTTFCQESYLHTARAAGWKMEPREEAL